MSLILAASIVLNAVVFEQNCEKISKKINQKTVCKKKQYELFFFKR